MGHYSAVASFVIGAYVFAWGCWLYLFISTPPGGMQAGISARQAGP